MDPFSLSVSIASLISLADLVVTKGTKFYCSVRDSPKEISTLIGDVAALSGVLSALSRVVDNQIGTTYDKATEKGYPGACAMQLLTQSDSQPQDRSISVASLDTVRTVEPMLLHTCRHTLEQLRDTVAKLESRPDETFMNAAKRIKWAFKEAEINGLLVKLERHKSSFQLAIVADNMYMISVVLIDPVLSRTVGFNYNNCWTVEVMSWKI